MTTDYYNRPDQDPILVSHTHIDRLVSLALTGPTLDPGMQWRPLSWLVLTPHRYVDFHRWSGTRHASELNASSIGQMLLRENFASLYAVSETEAHQNHIPIPPPPGTPPPSIDGYEFQSPPESLTLPEAFSALEYYEANASASRYWPSSEAHNFCTELRFALCHALARTAPRGPTDWDQPAGRSL